MKRLVLIIAFVLVMASSALAQSVTTKWVNSPMFRTKQSFISIMFMSDAKELLTLAKAGQYMRVPRGTQCTIVNRDDWILEVVVKSYEGTWFTPEEVFTTSSPRK